MISMVPKVLREAIKAVPAVKYALGVAGIVTVVAIVQAFKLDLRVAVFGTIVVFVFMVVLVVFAKLTTIAPRHFLRPVLVTMWAFLALAIASAVLLFSTVFFSKPKVFHDWLFRTNPATPVPATGAARPLIKAAQMQSGTGDYPGAWKQIEEALKTEPNSPEALEAQTRIAMDWLRNIRIIRRTGNETFSEIVDLVSPSLYRAASGAKGVLAADAHAHIGWGNYLKYREGVRGLDIEPHFKQALELDAKNVFAHTMWGHWILSQHGELEEANRHFAAAGQSGREPDFVKELHLAALLNWETKETRFELIRFANQLRLNHQQLDPEHRHRMLWGIYQVNHEEVLANLESRSPILPPAEHLATLNWLGEGLDQEGLPRRFFAARLTEATGDFSQALLLYRSLKAAGYSLSGFWENEINRGIARCDKQGANALPELLQLLKQTNTEARIMAIDSLADLRPDPKAVIPPLTNALQDENEQVREHTIRALGSIASNETAVVIALVEAFKDESEDVRLAACKEVIRVGRPAVPALLATLKADNPRARKCAVLVLERIGPEASDAAPQLTEALMDPNDEIRQAALSVLGKIGPAAKGAVPALIDILKSESTNRFGEGAAYVLGEIGPDAKDAVPYLTKMLKSRDGEPGYKGCAAAEALGKIGAAAKEAVPALADALGAYDEVRLPSYAAEALGKIGAEAKLAVPALIQAMKDEEKDHKLNQAEPLGLIAMALAGKGDLAAVPLLRAILRAFEEENFEPKVIAPVREALDLLKEKAQARN